MATPDTCDASRPSISSADSVIHIFDFPLPPQTSKQRQTKVQTLCIALETDPLEVDRRNWNPPQAHGTVSPRSVQQNPIDSGGALLDCRRRDSRVQYGLRNPRHPYPSRHRLFPDPRTRVELYEAQRYSPIPGHYTDLDPESIEALLCVPRPPTPLESMTAIISHTRHVSGMSSLFGPELARLLYQDRDAE